MSDIPAPHKPTGLDQFHAAGFHLDDMDVLAPGIDYREGHMYMTLPVDRDETKAVGKGKNTEYITERVTTTACVRSAGPSDQHPAVFPYDEENVREKGFHFPQTFTQAVKNRWPMDSLSAYLSGTAPVVDPQKLFADLRAVYAAHMDYPEQIHYDLVPLYLLGSYVFPIFQAMGYIHFNGTRDSGKSQNANLISAFGLNALWSSNMTPSSLFRTVAGCPGLICVDEAERDNWKSEKGAELRQIVLSGYAVGSTVARTEKGANDKFITVHYPVYCPKIISSIDPLDPTMQSRCIVIPMQRTIRDIPEFYPDRADHVELRGRIYTWAMQHHAEIRTLRQQWNAQWATRCPDLKARSRQISMPYLVLAEHFGGQALVDRTTAFLNDYFTRSAKAREDTDLQLTLLKALPRVLATCSPHPDNFYALKDIHEVAASYVEDDAKEYYKTRAVARHLVTLGFPKSQAAKGGKQIQIPEDVIRTAFARHHVTPFPEDVDWLAGTRSYQTATQASILPPEAIPLAANFGWLDQYTEDN